MLVEVSNLKELVLGEADSSSSSSTDAASTINYTEPVILTDILGLEVALGTMDFKVAGNEHGISTFQLDGLTISTLERAFDIRASRAAPTARTDRIIRKYFIF